MATQGAPATPFSAKVIVAVTQAGVLASWQIIRKDQSAGLQLRDSAGLYPHLFQVQRVAPASPFPPVPSGERAPESTSYLIERDVTLRTGWRQIEKSSKGSMRSSATTLRA